MSAGASSLTASVLGERPCYEERARSNFPADEIQRSMRLARDILIHLQTDEDSEIRLIVAKAWLKIGDNNRARPILETLKNDEKASVKLDVAKQFLKIGDKDSNASAIYVLKDLWSNRIYDAGAVLAEHFLKNGGISKAYTLLVRTLQKNKYEGDIEVRGRVADACGKIANLIKKIEESNKPIEWNYISYLSSREVGLYSKTPCISREVGYHRKKPYKKRDVIKKLSFLKSINHEVINKVAQPILKFLQKDEEFYVREHVATAIGTIGDSKLARPILEALQMDESFYVREHVAIALGKIGDSELARPILEALKNDEHHFVRYEVLEACEKIGDSELARPILDDLKNDEALSVKCKVLEVCGKIGDSELARPILDGLKNDQDPYIRLTVAEAYGAIGDSDLARPILEALKNEDDSAIRVSVAEAYAKIGDITWAYTKLDDLKNIRCERSRVAEICGTIGDSKLARPILEALKNDEDANVKLSVAKAFLKIGDRGEALNIFQGLKNDNAYIRTKIANAFLEFNLFDSVNK